MYLERPFSTTRFKGQTVALLLSMPVLLPSGALAQDAWDYSAKQKSACSEGNQQTMNSCMKREADKVERALNERVQVLNRTLRDPGMFGRAQSAWTSFRDRECEFANSGLERGASLYPYAQFACRIDLGKKRLKDLDIHVRSDCGDCPPKK